MHVSGPTAEQRDLVQVAASSEPFRSRKTGWVQNILLFVAREVCQGRRVNG